MGIVSLNLHHFIERRRENKKDEQIYFITLFAFFMLSAINYLFIGITDTKYLPVSFGISIGFLFFLLAAGMALIQKLKWSKPIGIIGIVYSLFYIALSQAGVFENWEMTETVNLITNGISGLVCIITLIIFGFYYFKTRMSPLLGLFLGILIPTIQFMTIIITGVDIPEIYNVILIIVINLIMFLGFKGKLDFKKRE